MLQVTSYKLTLLAGAFLFLLSAWYFALLIVPSGLGTSAPTVQQGFLPEWLGCREILHGRSPYLPEVTQRIELSIYGKTVSADRSANQHRFAYPVVFIFLFFPIALLPFDVAQLVMLVACLTLSAMSVGWWIDSSHLGKLDVLSYTTLLLAAYPVVLGLQLRQPTLLIAALLAFAVFCMRSGWLALSGVTAAAAASKPQLAIAVLIPLSIWAIASWRIRKTFLLSLGASLLVLGLASEAAVPGWIVPWLHTIRAYSHYAGARPPLADLTRGHLLIPAASLLVATVVWVSFEVCDSDPLLAISFSVTAFQLLFPLQIYNQVLLLPAALWAAKNSDKIRERGQLCVLLFGCAWIALASGWIAMLALSVWDIAAPGSGVKLWQVPLLVTWLYPMLLFTAFATLAASSLLARCRARLIRSIAR
jgi:hypothetical protein